MMKNPPPIIKIIIAVFFLSLPSPAFAQSDNPPGPPEIPAWEQIPDLGGYIALDVEQCCEGDNPCTEEPEAPDTGWNLGEIFIKALDWIFIRFWQNLFCAFLDILQHLANFFSTLANAVIGTINAIYKLILWIWFCLRVVIWHLLTFINTIIEVLNNVYGFILWLIEIVGIAMGLVQDLVMFILDILALLVAIFSWIGAIFFETITEIFAVLTEGDGMPAVPGADDFSPVVYATLRGILDAIFDSNLAWLMYLAIGACYVGWIAWFIKYLSRGSA